MNKERYIQVEGNSGLVRDRTTGITEVRDDLFIRCF